MKKNNIPTFSYCLKKNPIVTQYLRFYSYKGLKLKYIVQISLSI